MATDYTHLGAAFTLNVTGSRGGSPSSGGFASVPGVVTGLGGEFIPTQIKRNLPKLIADAKAGSQQAFTPLLPTTLNPFVSPNLKPGPLTAPPEAAPAPRAPTPDPFRFPGGKVAPTPTPLPAPLPDPFVPLADVIVTGARTVMNAVAPVLLPIFGLLTPTPTAGRRIDEFRPTDEPLFPIGEPVPEPAAEPDTLVGTATPLRDPRDNRADEPLDVISITGRRIPGPAGSPAPDLVSFPTPSPGAAPRRFASPQPAPAPRPGVGPSPFADPLTARPTRPAPSRPSPAPSVPFPGPVVAPTPRAPRAAPVAPPSPRPAEPVPGPAPWSPVQPLVPWGVGAPPAAPLVPPLEIPLAPFNPTPPRDASPCQCKPCPTPRKRKKDEKKRTPRTMCTRGVYTTSRTGISHTVKERFPCP